MSEEQKPEVKKSIRSWWAANPMTYGRKHGETEYLASSGTRKQVEFGSREFFEQADRTFYQWNQPLHDSSGYFGKIFDYEKYRGKRVLEVGCGMGCMAMNWALHGAQVTAVDLNPVAVEQTRRRFELFGLQGEIQEADGERLAFADHTFDYAYSWGVLHHSPETKKSIEQIWRVLKPGAQAGVMLYHRDSFLYKFLVEYVEGWLHLENDFLSPLQLASRYGDGAQAEGNPHTWPVTQSEARALFEKFENVRIRVLGTDLDSIFDFWFPMFSRLLPKPMLKALARRWGWSLWITGQKERRDVS